VVVRTTWTLSSFRTAVTDPESAYRKLILQTLELTELICTDFGNNGRNLLFPKFSFSVGICEISSLDC
jgi:hypothetical protein